MSRRCELTGKGPMTGNNVSHANNRTRRRFLPNLNDVSLQSEALGRAFKLRISAAALRSVDHRGGLDKFLAKAKDVELSDNALKIKKAIAKTSATATDQIGASIRKDRGLFRFGLRSFLRVSRLSRWHPALPLAVLLRRGMFLFGKPWKCALIDPLTFVVLAMLPAKRGSDRASRSEIP